MNKHTPGPWIFNGDEVVDSHDNTIALVNAMNQWNTTEGIVEEKMPWEANARLMAESPELYRKLKKAIQYIGLAACNSDKELQEKMEFLADVMVSIKRIEGDE